SVPLHSCCLSRRAPLRYPHSFPARRSSDLPPRPTPAAGSTGRSCRTAPRAAPGSAARVPATPAGSRRWPRDPRPSGCQATAPAATTSVAFSPRPEGAVVITAIVLVHTAADRIPETAQAIADLDGVSEVYSCAGDVDLIAIVKVAEHEQLADVIAGRLSKIEGVVRTDTHIAFRSYSRADTEATFSVGLD